MWNYSTITGKSKFTCPNKLFNIFRTVFSRSIDNESQENVKQPKALGQIDWTSYHSVESVYAWVDTIRAEFPQWITVEDIGTSFQGRPLKIVKLSKRQVLEIKVFLSFWLTFCWFSFCLSFYRIIGRFLSKQTSMPVSGSLWPLPHTFWTNFSAQPILLCEKFLKVSTGISV